MRLVNRGGEPLTFVADGLPTWEPGAELDVADALAEKLLAENPNTLVEVKAEAEPAKAEAPNSRGKGKSDDAAVTAEAEG